MEAVTRSEEHDDRGATGGSGVLRTEAEPKQQPVLTGEIILSDWGSDGQTPGVDRPENGVPRWAAVHHPQRQCCPPTVRPNT